MKITFFEKHQPVLTFSRLRRRNIWFLRTNVLCWGGSGLRGSRWFSLATIASWLHSLVSFSLSHTTLSAFFLLSTALGFCRPLRGLRPGLLGGSSTVTVPLELIVTRCDFPPITPRQFFDPHLHFCKWTNKMMYWTRFFYCLLRIEYYQFRIGIKIKTSEKVAK